MTESDTLSSSLKSTQGEKRKEGHCLQEGGLQRNQEESGGARARSSWGLPEGEGEEPLETFGVFVCLQVSLMHATAAHFNALFLQPSKHYQTVII